MKKSYEIDMCNGPLLGKIFLFAIPLMLSSILQLLFNAADIIVVGRFTGSTALAAVGSTSALINLLVNLFIGVSVGANVLVARFYGARDEENIQQTIHTAVFTAIVGGIVLIFLGVLIAKPMLALMGTPDNVLDQSALYMRIYFCGMPAFMLYNFGAAILRAVGDTKRPLYYLILAGIVNVILNLFFVIVFHMGVAGVALATIISQTISAAFIIRCLIKNEGMCRLCIKNLKIHKDKLIFMLRIGIPAGLQGVIFNVSNVLIQSSINSFGSVVMAGNTAANNIEGFVYVSMNALHQTALSFTGQNMGAGKYKRIDKLLMECVVIVSVIGLVMGNGAYILGDHLLGIYSSDAEVIKYGLIRLSVVASTYFLCGAMDVFAGAIRGMGYSVLPMTVSLIGACAFRVLWIFTIFKFYHTLMSLYISYPISWGLTVFAHFICYLIVRKREFAKV